MNKKRLYLCVFAFAAIAVTAIIIFIAVNKKRNSDISGISENKSNVFADYKFSESFDETSYMYLAENRDNFFVVTDYGIYKNIYKVSKKTGKADLLCSNPQCTHTDDTCSAYFDIYVDGLWIDYYNDRLYYTEKHDISDELRSEEWIMSMDLEGKDRKKEVKINDVTDNSESGYSISMTMYGKNVYLIKEYSETDENRVSHHLRAEIYHIDLETNEMKKIYEKSQKSIWAGAAAKKGNNIYFFMFFPDEADETKYICSTLIYDTNTGSVTEEDDGSYVFVGLSGDNQFYTTPYDNEGRILVKEVGKEEYREICNLGKDGTQCAVDIYGNYIIVNNWPVRNRKKEDKCIKIFDTDGNLIKKISTYGYTSDTKIANGYLFTEKKNENDIYDLYVCPVATDTDTWTKIN